MKSFSIEDAYLWVQRFVAREWRLLLPVAFAFMALPGLILELPMLQSAVATFRTATQMQNPAIAAPVMQWLAPVMVVILLIGALGGLAVTAMALVPGVSVREAIAIGLRRLGVLVLSLLAVIVMEMAVAMFAGLIFGLARPNAVGLQSLLSLVLVCFGVFVGVRFLPLVPMIVRRRLGPISALRESWIMTQGSFWRILGAAAIYLLGALVVMLALSTGIGAILLLLGRAIGLPELGSALTAVFEQGVAALIATGFHLLAAAIFLQLDRSSRGI